jgi:hypothetical protein
LGLITPRQELLPMCKVIFFSAMIDPTESDNEPRFILDFYVSVAVGEHFKVHAAVDNITGEIDHLGPLTKQTFSIGFTYFL